MSVVCVNVKLINAIDEALIHRGWLNSNQLRVIEFEAFIDTNAIRTVLPIDVVQQLGLKIRMQAIDRENSVAEPVIIEIGDRQTTVDAIVGGDRVRIGRTVLLALDLQIDAENQQLIPIHPDYPVMRI